MTRYLVLFIPQWDLEGQALYPAATVQANRISQVSVSAAKAGVTVGTRLRTARHLCPNLHLVKQPEIAAQRAKFSAITAVCADIIPDMTVWWPGRLSVPSAGATRYYGSEEEVINTLLETVSLQCGVEAQVGIADGILAATLAARQGRIIAPGAATDFVDPLPLDSCIDLFDHSQRGQVATVCTQLNALGLVTIKSLRALAVAELTSRFGTVGAILGRLIRHDNPFHLDAKDLAPTQIEVSVECHPPLTSASQARLYARHLGQQLAAKLQARGQVARRLEVAAQTSLTRHQRVWNLLVGANANQYTAYLESFCNAIAGQLDGAVTALSCTGLDLCSAAQMAPTLWGDIRPDTLTATARLQQLLGAQAVYRPYLRDGYSYRQRNGLLAWGEDPPPPAAGDFLGQLGSPYPSRIFTTPRQVRLFAECGRALIPDENGDIYAAPQTLVINEGAVSEPQHITQWWGPWRIGGRWWAGEQAVSYLKLETPRLTYLTVWDGQGWWLDAQY